MNWTTLATIFFSVFVAELGDKTQLATMLFSANSITPKLHVFFAAAFALVLSTAIAVAVGGVISTFIPPQQLKLIAGVGFIGIGGWILWAR
jgi:putative Ca2+/H+ antiporter (TMEM165/GDT1 family)